MFITAIAGLLILVVGGAAVVSLSMFPKATPTPIFDEPLPQDAANPQAALADQPTAEMLLPTDPPETPTPQPTPTLAIANPVCMRQVQQGEWLRRILQSFGQDYSTSAVYFSRNCSQQGNLTTCTAQFQLQDVNYLSPGQWLEIQGVTPEFCSSHGGTVASGQ